MGDLELIETSLRQTIDHVLEFTEKRSLDRLDYSESCFFSAQNLLNYLAFRQIDIQQFQGYLSAYGLSTLDRSEAHILPSLEAVLQAVLALRGQSVEVMDTERFALGSNKLKTNSKTLFGERPLKHRSRIMVTMPSAAADDPGIIASFLKAGMGLMRINCAHDSADSWHKMIDNLRLAQQSINKPCKVYMDLAGPKLRIGTMPSLGRFKRIKTRKNAHGQVVQNAEVEFYLQSKCVNNRPELVPVVALFDGGVKEGDIAVVQDGKGKARRLLVTQVFANKIIARCKKSVFFETDQIIELYRGGQLISRDQVALLPEVRDSITLYKGDLIDLLPPGHHEPIESGISSVNCTMKEVFYSAKVGQSICFDDGKIQGIIVKASHKQLRVEITHAKLSGSRLQGDKGINLPQTYLSTSAMTEKDQNDLIEMVQRVDLIGMSFVRKPSDIKSLKRMLETLRAMDKGVILKIENKMAFDNLAALLLTGLKLPKFGVMLARGDLAAEVGFERLAEVQEEILWLCEAAHVPVIWATQVLENLAKKHAPSRAEISDTVMASRAECVMLNKGENMVNTIEVLGDILSRMDTHQRKRKSKLRPLNVCFSPEDYDAPLPVDSIDKTNLEVDI